MEILNQIKAKKKTKSVIQSCVTKEHYEVAERMVEQYKNKFDDFLGYNELKRLLKTSQR